MRTQPNNCISKTPFWGVGGLCEFPLWRLMKKPFCILLLLTLHFSFFTSSAQDWQPVGTGIEDTGFYNMAMIMSITSFQGHLYAAGAAYGHCPKNDIAVLNGNVWDTVGGGITEDTGVYGMLAYDSVLYVAGVFNKAGNITAIHIAQWDGSNWDSVGSGLPFVGDADISNPMCVYNGELYLGLNNGTRFQGGIRVAGIAKWNGKYWDSVGTSVSITNRVFAMAVYKNKLYVGGALSLDTSYVFCELAVWDGTKWDSVPGLAANLHHMNWPYYNTVSGLQVYNNKLYVYGEFDSVAGMPAHHIAVWDGSHWDSVGGGTNENDQPSGDGMAIYHGNLIAGGFFDSAGYKPANSVARWDGSKWTPMGNGLSSAYWGVIVPSLYVWGDTLYAAGDATNSGSTQLHGVAKWHDDIYAGVDNICNEPPCTGVDIKVYPNPASTILNVEIQNTGELDNFCLYNVMGQLLECTKLNNSSNAVPVSNLPAGLYYYRVTDMNGNLLKADKVAVIH